MISRMLPRLGSMVLLLAFSGLLITTTIAAPPTGDSYYEKILREIQIEPDAAGLRAYLRSLHPDAAQRRRAAQLIRDLGSRESFAKREAAMAQLLVLPVQPAEALVAGSKGSDPEIRWRAKQILASGKVEADRVLYAALRTIRDKKLAGLVAEILRVIPLCDKRHLLHAAGEALRAATRPEDVKPLRRAIHDDNVEVRIASIAALARAWGEKAAGELGELLKDANDRVKLAAATALGNSGDRRCLAALVEILSSDEIGARARGASALRYLTGQQFRFTAYDTLEKRKTAIGNWSAWVKTHGGKAKLRFPLKDQIPVELGRTLISLYYQNRVVELDEQGEEVLNIPGTRYSGPWGATRLANGNLLVNWFSSQAVVEYDAKGKRELWKWDFSGDTSGLRYSWSAARLANGNTLVACNGAVVEVDRSGKIVWRVNIVGYLSDAIRLENGNTLISLMQINGRVVEVDRDGKVVWQITDLRQPYRLQRLPDGNTLVTEKGRNRVVEYDPAGKRIVWSRGGFISPDGAQRLSNGNTLVSDQQAIYEVDPSGKVVWKKSYGKSIAVRY